MADKIDVISAFMEPVLSGQNIAKKLHKQITSSSWWLMRKKTHKCVRENGEVVGKQCQVSS